MDWVGEDLGYIACSEKGCLAHIKNHAWAKIKSDDWFMMKNGTNYCPDHVPDWVKTWRARKGWSIK